jgi:hypothetical protein
MHAKSMKLWGWVVAVLVLTPLLATAQVTYWESRQARHAGWDRNTARATLGRSLAVSAFPRYVPV